MPEQTPDFFDRYWDSVAAGLPGELTDVDPIQAETVRRFHAADDVSGPEPAFLDRLEADLGLASSETGAIRSGAYPRSSMNGHSVSPSRRPSLRAAPIPQQHRWRFGAGAVPLLLALGIGIGYVLFGSGLFEDDRPHTIPAAVVPAATPSPELVREESLLTLTLPDGTLPTLDGGGSTLSQFAIPVGASWTWMATTDACCRALLVDHVLSGVYTVRFADDPVQVIRSGGTPQTVPAGTEIILGPGDTLISNARFAHEGANAGPATVQLLRWDFTPGTSYQLRVPSRWIANADNAHFFLADVPPGPATITLRLVDLPLDGAYHAPPGVRADLVFAVPMNVDAAGASITNHVADLGDGRVLNYGSGPVTLYVLTLEPLGAESTAPGAATSES